MGTEKWLGGLSASGLHLCGSDFRGGFTFKSGEPKKYSYCFTYRKFDYPTREERPKKHEWEKVGQRDRWCVYRRAGTAAKGTMPNRRGLYLRNNSLLCLYALLSSIVLLAALGTVFGLFAFFSRSLPSSDDFFRRAVAIIGLFALLLLSNFAFFLSMTSANGRILDETGDAAVPENAYRQYIRHKTFEGWLEKLLIKDGDILMRFMPLWLLTPRGFENWLGRMEKRGFNVYKVHRSGTLYYFIKGASRSVRYCLANSEGGTVARLMAEGWQMLFLTGGILGHFGRLAVLSQPFEGEPPVAFRNEKECISNAARLTLKYVTLYFVALIVLIAVYSVLVYFKAPAAAVWTAGAAVIVCTVFIVRVLLYLAETVLITKRGQYKQNLH